ncbi:MAG: hypothetical protein LQ346_004770 [Caloplaca aetnensis]|nr:MAG: hypothetical protein LQ346_004770 [Caloplaca aetnensis]
MGQGFSLATLASGPAGIDVPELSDLTYEKSLGQARLMKSIRARHRNGLVVVKLVMKPYPQLDLGKYVRAVRRERDALADVPNALGYQRVFETSTNGYLVRQYLYSSLYDRMSTRPFLEDIEKKWLAFQLLCAIKDCHARNIYHGDIKTENVLVTTWNWLYLTDFSSCYKKTRLPEDNPADFSYYFDISGRRTCYLAPERFLSADEIDDKRGVTWAMDVFSVGCVIAELFLESPVFTLSQLYKYRKGEFDPAFSFLGKIQDKDVRDLVGHMIQLDPESRYAADEYLNFWRRKVFPDYFYSFLHQYMGLITDPSSGRTPVVPETGNFGEADDRIDRVYFDFDKISYFLGYENEQAKPAESPDSQLQGSDQIIPVQVDIPNNRHPATAAGRCPVDDGSLIFLTLVASCLRNTARATARLRACDLMLAFAERITDEAKLDRVLPYATALLSSKSETVKAAAVRTITQLLALVGVVSPVNANVFTEYIRPRLQNVIENPHSPKEPLVRATYAACLATLARSSSQILDLVQALRADGSIPTVDPEIEDGVPTSAGYQTLFDVARLDLVEYFENHSKALLTDDDASVRRAFLQSVSNLCVFLGSPRASDVVLSHLNTYLNDRDWILKCAFIQTVVGVATFIGGSGLEDFILPVMVQALTDSEEYVVEQVLSSLASMAELGLLQRSKLWEMVDVVARCLVHPNIWMREAAAHFISASTGFLSPADVHCMISPLVQPYMTFPILEFSEGSILGALRKPFPRNVMELAMTWARKSQTGLFWKPAIKQRTFTFGSPEQAVATISSKDLRPDILAKLPKNEEDEQWLSRLRNLGMASDDDMKLVALRDYIWHMAHKHSVDEPVNPLKSGGIQKLGDFGITPQTVFFETRTRRAEHHERPLSSETGSTGVNRSPSTGPHTIADALLEATTTIDDPLSERKRSLANARKERLSGLDAASNQKKTHSPSLDSESFDGRRNSSDSLSPRPSEGPIASAQKRSPASTIHERKSDGALTPTEPSSRERGRGMKHKSSAIDLLHKKDTAKASAETSTTATNAFGQVEGLHKAEGPISGARNPNSRSSDEPHSTRNEIHTTHTYDGNDPNILKLLTSLALQSDPLDVVDFGPLVTPIGRRSSMKKAGSQNSGRPWRPEGTLVTTLGEHVAPINRVIPAPDHAFFLTASDDGFVKVWDTLRLERNLSYRSRQTHQHMQGARVKCATFVQNTHTFVSGATDGSINVVKVEYRRAGDASRYGKIRLVREYQLPQDEYAVCMEHFKADAQSVLIMATNKSRVIALDLRDMSEQYILEMAVHHGTPTTLCLDPKHHWLLVGTTHGVLDFWDLRWKLRVRSWGLSGGTPIHCMRIHPFHGKNRWVCVSGGTGQTDITVWDLESGECKEVYRLGGTRSTTKDDLKAYDAFQVDEEKPGSMLGRFASSVEAASAGNLDRGIRALEVGLDRPDDGREAKTGFFLTGGSDRKLRYWDTDRIERSKVISGLDIEEEQPKYTTAHPTTNLSLYTETAPRPEPSAPNAAADSKPLANTAAKKTTPKPPRSTVISQQQQHLLRNHLDTIMDVAILESPVGMVVSVDRSGIIKVFQ